MRVFESLRASRCDKSEVADLIDRFLEIRELYLEAWNDFVECPQKDPDVEVYGKTCDELDPLLNRPDPIDQEALAELRLMAEELRPQHPRPLLCTRMG